MAIPAAKYVMLKKRLEQNSRSRNDIPKNSAEMTYLRTVKGYTRTDQLRNLKIRKGLGISLYTKKYRN
jgi:hypothetical protein